MGALPFRHFLYIDNICRDKIGLFLRFYSAYPVPTSLSLNGPIHLLLSSIDAQTGGEEKRKTKLRILTMAQYLIFQWWKHNINIIYFENWISIHYMLAQIEILVSIVYFTAWPYGKWVSLSTSLSSSFSLQLNPFGIISSDSNNIYSTFVFANLSLMGFILMENHVFWTRNEATEAEFSFKMKTSQSIIKGV